MNYYRDWWNKARVNSGIILTKPVIRRKLQARVQELSQYKEIYEQATQEAQKLKKQNQALTILAQDRKQRLEQEQQALIKLAKQKLTNKKEFQELVNDWQQDKEGWEQERQILKEKISQMISDGELVDNIETSLLYNKITNLEKKIEELETEKQKLIVEEKQTIQDQLRQINLLFDENAGNYKTIDFNGLYSLLQQIAERERERERR